MFKQDYERKRISCINIIVFQWGFWKDYERQPIVTVVVVIVWKLDLQLPIQPMPTTTNVVISNPAHEEVHLIQHYVIKFVSDLRQVDGFIQVFLFPTVQNWPRRYSWNTVESSVKYHNPKTLLNIIHETATEIKIKTTNVMTWFL